MSYENISIYGTAGNTVDSTIYTAPADSSVVIGNITAYNSTAGSLTLTLKAKENDGTLSVLCFDTVSAACTNSYSGGSIRRITPLTLMPGNSLTAKGSATGINVRASALRFF